MIEVQGLTRTFGSVVAVRDVTFRVRRGVVLGLLGPNGAGKTTTLRMLSGVLGPSAGTIKIAGHDIIDAPMKARRCLGYLAETAPMYPEMRVGDYLAYRAALKGIQRRIRREAVIRSMKAAHCNDVELVRVVHLSRGYRQRVGLADALLAAPPVLLLDEPTAGLDPNQIREVRELIAQLGQKLTILLSTHVLAEVEAICTEAVVIHQGRLIAYDTLDALRTARKSAEVTLSVRDPDTRTPSICSELGWSLRAAGPLAVTSTASIDANVVSYVVQPLNTVESLGIQMEALATRLVKDGVGVRDIHRSLATLEKVFSELTATGEARD